MINVSAGFDEYSDIIDMSFPYWDSLHWDKGELMNILYVNNRYYKTCEEMCSIK
jgi:hypothetical protein